jgi:hypothetical protein
MYRKPRFLEKLHEIREEMARECDYDAELLAEMVRSGRRSARDGRRFDVSEPFPPAARPATLKSDSETD